MDLRYTGDAEKDGEEFLEEGVRIPTLAVSAGAGPVPELSNLVHDGAVPAPVASAGAGQEEANEKRSAEIVYSAAGKIVLKTGASAPVRQGKGLAVVGT